MFRSVVATRSAVGVLAVMAVGLPLAFQNCSNFEVSDFGSRQALMTGTVFSPRTLKAASIMPGSKASLGASALNFSQVEHLEAPPMTNTSIDNLPPVNSAIAVSSLCNDDLTRSLAARPQNIKHMTLTLLTNDSGGTKIHCQVRDPVIKEGLAKNNSIPIPDLLQSCPKLASGEYQLVLSSDSASTTLQVPPRQNAVIVNVGRPSPAVMSVTYSEEPEPSTCRYIYSEEPPPPPPPQAQDPLFIKLDGDVDSETSGLILTDAINGVLFDILGAAATPTPYEKKKVAWFDKRSRTDTYLVALPNEFGEVKGIDELFGNMTVGPDNAFSPHGFEALRKWDGLQTNGSFDNTTRDGVIDARDPVFPRLRFWADRNHDAVAQPSELFSAEDLGIVSLDLNYDPRYWEVDKYKNQVMLKSTVKTSDGRSHLMYDLWLMTLN